MPHCIEQDRREPTTASRRNTTPLRDPARTASHRSRATRVCPRCDPSPQTSPQRSSRHRLFSRVSCRCRGHEWGSLGRHTRVGKHEECDQRSGSLPREECVGPSDPGVSPMSHPLATHSDHSVDITPVGSGERASLAYSILVQRSIGKPTPLCPGVGSHATEEVTSLAFSERPLKFVSDRRVHAETVPEPPTMRAL